MKKHLILIALICQAIVLQAENILKINQYQALPDADIVIHLEADNDNSFVAFQVDIPIPEGFKYVASSAVLNTERTSGHMLSTSQLTGNVLRLIGYSPNNVAFSGSSGAVVSFSLKAGKVPGTFPLQLNQAMLGDNQSTNILTGTSNGSITVLAPDIQLSATNLNFNRVALESYAENGFYINNTGNQNLVINSLSFDDQQFSTTASSSITIAGGTSQYVPVRFTPVTKGSYTKSLYISSNDPDQSTIKVTLEAVAYAVNELHTGNISGASSSDYTLEFNVNNMEPFTGIQFDINLPQPMTYLSESATLYRRDDHIIAVNAVNTNTLRILAFSAANKTFTANEGKLIELGFHLNGTGGYYPISISNVMISDANGENILSASYGGSLQITSSDIYTSNRLEFGEVSMTSQKEVLHSIYNYGQEPLIINQLTFSNSYFNSNVTLPVTVQPYQQFNLPVVFRKTVKGQAVGTMKIYSNDPDESIYTVELVGNAFAPNYIRVSPQQYRQGEDKMLEIEMDNVEDIVALQFDMSIPSGFTPDLAAATLSDRKKDHVLLATTLNSTTVRLIVYSPGQQAFSGQEGTVLQIPFKADETIDFGDYTVQFSNALMSNDNSENVLYGTSDGTMTVNGPVLKPEPTSFPTIFSATSNSPTSINVSWTDAIGSQLPDGYLIKAALHPETPSSPVDGVVESDATLVKSIPHGTQSVVFGNLTSSTSYNFSIWPYTNTGTDINYKMGSQPTSSAETEELIVPNVIITEVYGGGGNDGATFKNDFIELFNTTESTIDVGGWSVQYYSATGTGTNSNRTVIPDGSIIPAKSHFLIKQAAGSGGTDTLYRPDVAGGIAISATTGKIILFSTNVGQTISDIASITGNAYFKDYVPFGTTAVPVWGSAMSSNTSNSTSATRKKFEGVYVYTQNSGNDFAVTSPSPQNKGAFKSITSGNWGATTTWEFTDNGTWVDASITPTSLTSPVQIETDHEVTIAASATSSTLTLKPGAKLTINTENTLSVSGNVTLQSNANEGTATLVDKNTNGGLTVSGVTHVQQFLTGASGSGRDWWYIATPVTGAKTDIFALQPIGGINKMGYYQENKEGGPAYVQITNTTTTLLPGVGYALNIGGGDSVFTFSGTLNNESITLNPTRTGTTHAKRGFNLIGNPYPSYLNWQSVSAASNNTRPTIWYRTRSGTEMTFGTYSASTDFTLGNAKRNIPPLQAFWMRVNVDGSDGVISLSNSMRLHDNAVGNPLKAPKETEKQFIRLMVSNGVNQDETVIVSIADAHDGYDFYDSEKMTNNNVNIPEIFTLAGDEELVINALNSIVHGKDLVLGFRPGKLGEFTIGLTDISNIDYEVVLNDKLIGEEKVLALGEYYSFSSDAQATNERFSILFRTPGSTNEIETMSSSLKIFTNSENHIVIQTEKLNAESNVNIYNLTGQRLVSTQLNGVETVINTNMAPGIYLVTISDGLSLTTRPVLIK